ncbi:peptidase inhibitor family I36 protein [Streptomyces sp. NPDC004752]
MARAVGAGAVALTAALAMPAAAAQAAPQTVRVTVGQGPSACMPGMVCLYENYDLNAGGPARVLQTDEDIDWLGNYGFNDRTSSVCNFTGHVAALYKDRNYGGIRGHVVFPGECRDVPAEFNDEASSLRLS